MSVMGISGGGPYTAAVAAELGTRIAAAALVSPVGPIAEAPGSELVAFHRFCFTTLPRNRRLVSAVFRTFRWLLARSERAAMSAATIRAPEVDRRLAANPDISARFVSAFIEGLKKGVDGPAIDLEIFSKPWGVDLAAVKAVTHVWIGTRDTSVPVSAAKTLAASIPGAGLTVLDAGHLWIAANYSQVLAWLADTSRTNP
jgi:pimeloyl-ACP methyl ester carboxylesterase